ncbi:hypothetical protein JST99_02110 [Candidatus Dependentiae bacterium]|nr:hypothetical protein [Candidatus Dependentiae bacterium]MCC7415354.1 hypothetical protein [Campylobacterota bacterium]
MKRCIPIIYVGLQFLGVSLVSIPIVQAKPALKTENKKYVIGAHQGGFFAAFLAVLNHLAYCKRAHKIPVVYWDARSWYYRKEGFNGSYNAWEYYFKPVSNLKYVPKKDRLHASYDAPYNTLHYTNLDNDTRHTVHNLITEYIHINSIVQGKIDTFYQQHMAGGHTVGIHLRGTDKCIEMKPIAVEKIIATALEHALPDTRFFIASDEQQLLARAAKLLDGHTVIFYDCYRSPDTNKPLHIKNTDATRPSCAQLGEDVLVEMSLFALCDVLVHTRSNVSAAALYYNPRLKNVVVSE